MADFVKHSSCDNCGSSDARAIYSDGSSYCFSCESATLSEEYKQLLREKKLKTGSFRKEAMDVQIKSNKPAITDEENQEIKSRTSSRGNNFRYIRDDITSSFGVRTEFDEHGNVVARYYPCTQEGQLAGYKVREIPKNFRSIGRTGADCELFGQFKFNRGGKYVMIVEGEEDQLSAYQMLKDYNMSKGHGYETAVVSPTTGANSHKQIAAQYRFFDSFDQIILCFDNDKAGQDAVEKVIKHLPKGKVKIMRMRYKDANEYLVAGKQKDFINDFYDSKAYVPVGIVGSGDISGSMRDEFLIPKIPLPPFMHKLQSMMAGGIPLKRIVNLASASGTGKSTIVDEIIYYMIFNSPHLCGIVTLESDKGQYGIKLLSRHISRKIELLPNEEALALLENPKIKAKEKELFWKDEDTHRFYLVDDRDSGVDNLKEAIENLIISCGCKVIVCDPLSDVIAQLPLDQQDSFMAWQKGMVKSHDVTFINVCHTRKTSGNQTAGSAGADLHEEDIIGSSSIYKSAACNLMFSRNKEAEDEIQKNTTTMKATKIRWTGKTGIAGKYYYDNESHTLYDLDDWLEEHGTKEF